ncbi:hypothetical protein [Nocardia aurea]|uniref:Ribbon-helix-helix protein, CopG family n=1 Tax=Nocardia aurea TaxID=2144174 RepID=A0ABV3G1W3_9NOCA
MVKSGRTLQVRVDDETARKFAVVARARRMTESELLRVTINNMLRETENNVDMLKAKLRAEFEEATRDLDELLPSSPPAAASKRSQPRR